MDPPPTLAIKEANTHLQALHERNQRLEKENIELHTILDLKRKQDKKVKELEELLHERDRHVEFLENEINRLVAASQDSTKKDLIINQLTRKVKILNEILKYKSALESVMLCLEQVEEDFIVDIDNLVQLSNGTVSKNTEPVVNQNSHQNLLADRNNNENTDENIPNPNHETTL